MTKTISIIALTMILITSPTLMGSTFADETISRDGVSIQMFDDGTEIIRGNGLIAVITPDIVDATDDTSIIVAPGGTLDGVGDFVFDTTSGSGFRCSGSLLQDGLHVLTAAHCVTDGTGTIDYIAGSGTVTFEGDLGDEAIDVDFVFVHPNWDGSTRSGDDIAVLQLVSEPSVDITRYNIDTNSGDDIGQVIELTGYGRSGTGTTGDVIPSGTKRTGDNRHELGGDVFLSGLGLVVGVDFTSNSQLPYDFDNGLAANDAFDVFFATSDLGESNEVDQANGDSGGPSFNGAGEITGVHSYSTSVRFSDGTGSDIDNVDGNDTFGEFSVDARVSTYAGWIQDAVDTKGEINGMKFDDTNGNGVKDGGEPGIENWQMDLSCDNGYSDSTSTDSDGNYSFANIPTLNPTTCVVTEETVTGWTATTPGTAPDSADIDLSGEVEVNDVDFGNFKDVTIMGEKWQDTDADGTDNSEPRLGDWEITLTHEGGILELVTTTADGLGADPLGKYSFGPLGPEWAGNAEICETVQPGWIPSHPETGCIDVVIQSGGDLGETLPDDATDFGNILAIDAEKSWTHTDYNWDEVCDGFVNPSDELCYVEETFETLMNFRPANIDNPDDEVLADALEQDANDKYLAFAQVHKNDRFSNTNPGAFYALTTIDVLANVDGLSVLEEYEDCTDQAIGDVDPIDLKLVSPQAKPERSVKIAIANPDGDVTEITDDIYDGIGGSIIGIDNDSAHVEIDQAIESGSTVYVLVKFQDDLKGYDTVDGIFDGMCHNQEIVGAVIGDLSPAGVTAEADLRITNQE